MNGDWAVRRALAPLTRKLSDGACSNLHNRARSQYKDKQMKTVLKVAGGVLALALLCVAALAVYIYMTALRPAKPVGFQHLVIEDPGHQPISAAVWYPTSAQPGFMILGLRGAHVAPDGPVQGTRLPLIVISHGTGASETSHADTALALAENGYVVIAPSHTGDNFQDQSDVGRPDWLVNRTRHLRLAVDMLFSKWKDHGHLDAQRVGIFGFSAGGTTALIAIGGKPDLTQVSSQCKDHPEFVCQIMRLDSRSLPPQSWKKDPRIRAAVVAAPGLGFTFAPGGLAEVDVPVQLWAGANDQTVPLATNAGIVKTLLPATSEMHVVPGAAHLSFLMPCGLIGPPEACREPGGFHRSAFHTTFNDSVVKFFGATLASSGDPK